MPHTGTFAVTPAADEPLAAAIERGLTSSATPLTQLPQLSGLALGDPYLAQQLLTLRAAFELRPQPTRGLLARLRARLAWLLLGPELRQQTETNATLVRIVDSLLAQIDADRAKIQALQEQLAFRSVR
jgi:hypothetical protein